MTVRRSYLSPEELYALEQRARRERSETVARLFVRGVKAIRLGIARAAAVLEGRFRAAGEPTRHGA